VRILDERSEALVERERGLLGRLISFLKGFGAPKEDAELVRRALSDLEEMFLLVIVGEFNSGKSAFVNALLGADIAEEGVTPTTDRIIVLRHAEEPVERSRRDGVLERGYPNGFLREISIVDTPGTNAIIRHHEELSRSFVPRSDLVLFVTSAERPLTESERGYLQLIRDWGKKILLVINKADLLAEDAKRDEVRSFVDGGIRSALGLTPDLLRLLPPRPKGEGRYERHGTRRPDAGERLRGAGELRHRPARRGGQGQAEDGEPARGGG